MASSSSLSHDCTAPSRTTLGPRATGSSASARAAGAAETRSCASNARSSLYECVTLQAAPPQRSCSANTLAPLNGATALLNQERLPPTAPSPAAPHPLSMADALCCCCTLPLSPSRIGQRNTCKATGGVTPPLPLPLQPPPPLLLPLLWRPLRLRSKGRLAPPVRTPLPPLYLALPRLSGSPLPA
eukprot:scaffold6216_cov35-Phaeocystis_antarctica.AAC.1